VLGKPASIHALYEEGCVVNTENKLKPSGSNKMTSKYLKMLQNLGVLDRLRTY
jgi:hypothetical protein